MTPQNLYRWLTEDESGLRMDLVEVAGKKCWELEVENPLSNGESLDGDGNELLLFYGTTPQAVTEKADRWFSDYYETHR